VATLDGLLEGLTGDSGKRGSHFERICQRFLTNDPLYRRDWLRFDHQLGRTFSAATLP
jgi:hypothetical protein